MRLTIDVSGKTFRVGRPAEPKKDQNGVQRVDRATQLPLWTVQLGAKDATGFEAINVTVAADTQPRLTDDQLVVPVGLEVIYWQQGQKSGLAYRAQSIQGVSAAKAA